MIAKSLLYAGLILIVGTQALAAEERISAPGQYQGYSSPNYSGYARSNFYVEARDGVRLAVTLYRPVEDGKPVATPHPAVLSLTPYRRLYRTPGGDIRGAAEPARDGQRGIADLTKYGYVVAVADVRGKGASFGVRSAYQDENEARDGYDLVEWLASQTWTTDKVGMFGCSYSSGTQYAAARKAPPHLKAIFVKAGPFDAYQMVRRGGISGQFFTRYQSTAEDMGVLPVDSDHDGKLLEQAIAQHEANGQMLDLIKAIPHRDGRDPATDIPYWRLVSPHEYVETLGDLGIAVYHWGNWFDEIADQSLISFATLESNPRKLIMGGGTHCDTGPIDSFSEHLRFFDRYLKNIDNGIDREPPIYFHTLYAPSGRDWEFAETWPPAGVSEAIWYLSDQPSGTLDETGYDGSLQAAAPTEGQAEYQVSYEVGCRVDPRFHPGVGSPPLGEAGKPQPGYWSCVLDDIAATFTSEPLSADRVLTGSPVLDLHFQASVPDLNVFAYLERVTPDGEVEIFSHGRLRTSARQTTEAPYENFGLPWHSNTRAHAVPVPENKTVSMQLALSPTSIWLSAGTRLRLTIAGADLRQRDLEDHIVSPAPLVTMLTGAKLSSISLPFREIEH